MEATTSKEKSFEEFCENFFSAAPPKKVVPGFVYVARGTDDLIKIGFVNKRDGILKRLYSISLQYKMGFTLLFALETNDARGLEKEIHQKLSRTKVGGYNGTELFRPTERQMSFLGSISSHRGEPVVRINAIDLI